MMKQANSRPNPGDLVDRISALPDSILSLILSCIPTKNAVATSVLSKRWESLWKAVHNLDFNLDLSDEFCKRIHDGGCNCNIDQATDEGIKFAHYVNNVLLLHDGGSINKFSLVWMPICIPSQVISWINIAITRNIHELSLCVSHFDEPLEIPSSVFSGCETLKSMKLEGNMFVPDSIVVCLPRLESLSLVSVYFHSDKTFQKLISGCPVLDYLLVEMDIDIMTDYIVPYRKRGTNFFDFVISSTSLKDFVLYVESENVVYEDLPYCSLELEAAPSLKKLQVEGFVPEIFVRQSLSSLVEADFSMLISKEELSDASICNSLVEAIRACDCAQSINLSKYVLAALSIATIGLSTKFKRLTEFTTKAWCCYCSSVQDFIQCSDNLQLLVVEKDYCPCYGNYSHTHSNWTTPLEVPRCLSNSLKWIQFIDFGGYDYEFEMIGYILMHGSVLEKMSVCRK